MNSEQVVTADRVTRTPTQSRGVCLISNGWQINTLYVMVSNIQYNHKKSGTDMFQSQGLFLPSEPKVRTEKVFR